MFSGMHRRRRNGQKTRRSPLRKGNHCNVEEKDDKAKVKEISNRWYQVSHFLSIFPCYLQWCSGHHSKRRKMILMSLFVSLIYGFSTLALIQMKEQYRPDPNTFPTVVDVSQLLHIQSNFNLKRRKVLHGEKLAPMANMNSVDYGDIHFKIPVSQRVIPDEIDEEIYAEVNIVKHYDFNYKAHCEDVSWVKDIHYTCNQFHELDLTKIHTQTDLLDSNDADIVYSSHGYYRDVWKVLNVSHTLSAQGYNTGYNNHQNAESSNVLHEDAIMALKTLKLMHNVTEASMAEIAQEALIMEKLTSSPKIMNVYSYCATSLAAEFLPNEIQSKIVPGSGSTRTKSEKEQLIKNEFTPREKLEVVLAMAESLAVLHGYKDGVIVHNDVQPCQWLERYRPSHQDSTIHIDSKHLVLGDFNRATILRWNKEKQAYCKYRTGEAFGTYRSPEEYKQDALNEKIDIFSLGNNIYALLTSLWIFPNDEDEVAQGKLMNGELSAIDETFSLSSPEEKLLVEIMQQCWRYDSAERIDAFEIVKLLREFLEK